MLRPQGRPPTTLAGSHPMPERRALFPFAALSASYFAHIGFFNPYLPLWLKDLGLGLVAISVLTSVQAATRLFAPYIWGWISDHSGERVRLMRLGAAVALASACLLWLTLSPLWLGVVLLVMFTHTSAMMPMSEAAMAHLVSQGGQFDAKRYGRVRLWFIICWLLSVAQHVCVLMCLTWFKHFRYSFPSSKQRPHHFINFPALNQFNFKVFLINSFVVFRNDDFIKAQFFCFINSLFNTIHRSNFSR